MKHLFIICIVLCVSGCATPSVYSSNPRSVVISTFLMDASQAQSVADGECKKYGRFARLSGELGGHKLAYDCVL